MKNIKTVLITGATGGLGRSIADEFYEKEFHLILTGTNDAKLDALRSKFVTNTKVIKCNLAKASEINDLFGDIEPISIDILINNAGITKDNLFLRMKDQDWDEVLNVNLKANDNLCKKVIKGMIKKRWGRIINITSVVCHTGNPGQANYCASKSGIIGMSKSIALEVAKRGITVNCISPGFIETAMTSVLSEQQKDSIINKIPMAKIGSPTNVAHCVEFLASDKSSYITGQTIHVNGGLAML